jgi:hypothetical protein
VLPVVLLGWQLSTRRRSSSDFLANPHTSCSELTYGRDVREIADIGPNAMLRGQHVTSACTSEAHTAPDRQAETARIARALRSSLGTTAGKHAHAALDAYRCEDFEIFYVRAGIALELAMKAKLAGISPYLLAPDGAKWFQHGQNFAKGVSAKGLRSVSADQALHRMHAIEPALMAAIGPRIEETITRRDQSVHVGVYSKPSDEELLSHAAAFVEAVNGLLLQEPRKFWSDLAGLASELVADERNVVRVRVETKLSTARALFATLTYAQRSTLSDNGSIFFEDNKDDVPELVLVDCPVCNNEAVAGGELTDDGEPAWDREPDPVGWMYDIKTVITSFECEVCQLRLDGADEVAAAGLPPELRNDHADPGLLYEPDWERN